MDKERGARQTIEEFKIYEWTEQECSLILHIPLKKLIEEIISL